MAEFGRPDRHRKDVQNALILIWQENVILKAFFMINILASLRGCSDGRIWPVEPQLQTPRTKVQNKAGFLPKEGFAIRS